MRWLKWGMGAGVVVAVPLALAFGSVHAVLYDPGTYAYAYARYDAARRTGLTPSELAATTQAFLDYFAGRGDLDVQLERDGVRRPLFNARELFHMHDVRELFWLGDRVALGAAVYIALFALVGLLTRRIRVHELAWLGLAGSALTFAIGLLFGVASFLDFESLFIQFHLLSFDNDAWLLDPRRDYLIMLFPQPFWFDCAIRIAAMTLGGAVAIAVVSFLVLRAHLARARHPHAAMTARGETV